MIKFLLSAVVMGTTLTVSAQSFNALYPFTAVTNTSGVTDPTPVPVATGVTFSAFISSGVSANPNASGRFTFTGWGTGASTVAATVDTYSAYTGSINTTQYYQVSVSPLPNYAINFNQIRFDMRRSGTGIRNYAIRSSNNAYASNLPASIAPANTNLSVLPGDIFFWNFDATSTANDQKGSTISLAGAPFQNVSSSISFRFYAWNAESNAGTFSIDSVNISGTAVFGVGVKEYSHSLNAGFKLTPNPSSGDVVNLEILDDHFTKVEITDVAGKLLRSQIKNAEKNLYLNVSDLESGTYLVRMIGTTKVYSQKLIVLH